MKDGSEESSSDGEPTESESTDPARISPDHSVPAETEWSQVAQKHIQTAPSNGLTTTIISAVADAEGADPMDITSPPLYDVLDTAALEAAFFQSEDRRHSRDENASTEFLYRAYRIVVQSDGWVRVYEERED